ncbi:MAG: hypothetical protein AAGB32_02315 [Pseudomonadota bacterium]
MSLLPYDPRVGPRYTSVEEANAALTAYHARTTTRNRIGNMVASSNTTLAIKMTGQRVSDARRLRRERLAQLRDDMAELKRLRTSSIYSQYRDAALAHQGLIITDYPIYQMTDGIVGTSTKFYAWTRDQRTKEQVGFWARSPYYLRTTVGEDGYPIFADGEYRYHMATLPWNAGKEDKREAISSHHKKLRGFAANSMTVYGGDMSDFHDKTPRSGCIYGYTNDSFAVSIHRCPAEKGGGWTLKASKAYVTANGERTFVPIDNLDTEDSLKKAIQSNGVPVMHFKSRAHAHAQMFMMLDQKTQMVWGAINLAKLYMEKTNKNLKALTDRTTDVYNWALKEVKDPENISDATFDAGKAAAAAVLANAVLTISFPVAITVAIIDNFFSRKALETYKDKSRDRRWKKEGAAAYHPDQADHIDATLENMDREVNRKPNRLMDKFLRVLDGKECDVTHDPVPQKSTRMRNKGRMELTALDGKAYARKVSQLNLNMSTEMYFNGTIRLVRKDPETNKLVTYVKYVDALNVNPRIALSQSARKILGEGDKIVKFTQEENRMPIQEEVCSFEQMVDEVMDNMEEDDDALTAHIKDKAKRHISWLFDNKAKIVEPEEVDDDVPAIASKTLKKSLLAKTKDDAMAIIYGDRSIRLKEPSKALIEFFKGCEMPCQKYIVDLHKRSQPTLSAA